jgi:hypothetical protein
VREQQVVRRGRRQGIVAVSLGVSADAVALVGDLLWLVECDPEAAGVADRLGHEPRVVGEALGGVALGPAAVVLERLRQVPVVQRDRGRDATTGEPVDERAIEVEPRLVRRSATGWLNARPSNEKRNAFSPRLARRSRSSS